MFWICFEQFEAYLLFQSMSKIIFYAEHEAFFVINTQKSDIFVKKSIFCDVFNSCHSYFSNPSVQECHASTLQQLSNMCETVVCEWQICSIRPCLFFQLFFRAERGKIATPMSQIHASLSNMCVSGKHVQSGHASFSSYFFKRSKEKQLPP